MPAIQAMTAMMWKPLIHRSIIAFALGCLRARLKSGAVDAGDEPLHVPDRRLRQHTMTEIENKRSVCERRQNFIDRAIKRGASGQQRRWIEITLNRPPLLDLLAGKGKFNHPIEPNRIDGYSRYI